MRWQLHSIAGCPAFRAAAVPCQASCPAFRAAAVPCQARCPAKHAGVLGSLRTSQKPGCCRAVSQATKVLRTLVEGAKLYGEASCCSHQSCSLTHVLLRKRVCLAVMPLGCISLGDNRKYPALSRQRSTVQANDPCPCIFRFSLQAQEHCEHSSRRSRCQLSTPLQVACPTPPPGLTASAGSSNSFAPRSHNAADRMSASLIPPLLLLKANREQCRG